MKVIEPVERMRAICRRLAREGKSIRFVPTMGALHDGHGSLIRRALEDEDAQAQDDTLTECRPTKTISTANGPLAPPDNSNGGRVVIVSIFVNPTQFNDPDDFIKYPKTAEADLERCKRMGVHYVFMPKCEDIYRVEDELDRINQSQSQNQNNNDHDAHSRTRTDRRCIIKPPAELAQDLEGKSRKNHFEGMLTVVCKFFNIIQPNRAYFGLKDYQQLVLAQKMTEDLNMPIKICPVEIVREPETNLPLSSRNVRLSPEQRRLAAQMMYDLLVSTKRSLEDKCRLSIKPRAFNSSSSSSSYHTRGDQLNSILLGSMLTCQLCSELSDDDVTDHHYRDNIPSGRQITIDYFELRCAKDLSVISNDQQLGVYDCGRGCVRRRFSPSLVSNDHDRGAKIEHPIQAVLEARLLITIWMSNVRLLDNIGVQLNLMNE